MSLDLRTGKTLWSIKKPRSAQYKRLTKNIHCEVAVVGGAYLVH
jgi:hypothetical protein